MFFRKHWFFLAFLIVAICGVSLYLLHINTPKEPVLIIKSVEPLEKPTAQVPEGDTSQGGHFHADGTWHEGPHERPAELPAVQRPQPQSEAQRHAPVAVSQQRMLPEDILSPEYIAMVKKAVETAIATRGLDTERGDALWADAYNLIIEARGDAQHFRRLFHETGDEMYLDKYDEIMALDEPYREMPRQSAKPKLSSEQLSQLRKAADEFDALLPKNPIGGEPLPNPYRERLQEEENR